jgi:hypothetical protein
MGEPDGGEVPALVATPFVFVVLFTMKFAGGLALSLPSMSPAIGLH